MVCIVLSYSYISQLSHIRCLIKQQIILLRKYTEDLCDALGNVATGDFPTHTEKPAFGVFGLMGNGFQYMEHMEKLVFFLYRHPTEGNVMSDYN